MKLFFKEHWKRLVALAVSLIIILGVSYVTSGCTYEKFTEALVAWGTIGLAFIAFFTIQKTIKENKLTRKEALDREERDRKERLLDKVVEWVTDIQKASLEEEIPVTGGSLSEEDKKAILRIIDANTLRRNAMHFHRNDYIRAIVNKTFKEDLQPDTDKFIYAFSAVIFCEGKSLGIKDTKSTFTGTAIKIIEEVEEKLIKGQDINELLRGYRKDKAECASNLLIKAGNIVASLK